MIKSILLLQFFIFVFHFSNAQNKQVHKQINKSSKSSHTNENIDYGGTKFCFNDFQGSGNKFELSIIDGGKAVLVRKDSYDKVIGKASGTWEGKSDGPGGDMAKIYLRISTGLLLFNVVIDDYTLKISMLIDSKDNQWQKCW